jgi:hypothetical protein
MLSTPFGDAARPGPVPHQVLYVFADFPEVVQVDCSCAHAGDHVEMYPFTEEVLRPLVDRLVHHVRRLRRRRRVRLFRRLTGEEPHAPR